MASLLHSCPLQLSFNTLQVDLDMIITLMDRNEMTMCVYVHVMWQAKATHCPTQLFNCVILNMKCAEQQMYGFTCAAYILIVCFRPVVNCS